MSTDTQARGLQQSTGNFVTIGRADATMSGPSMAVTMRHTKNPRMIIQFSREEWRRLVEAFNAGEFDEI
jgi:hypothetical protein